MEPVSPRVERDDDRPGLRPKWFASVVSFVLSIPVRVAGQLAGAAVVAVAVLADDLPYGSGYPAFGRVQVFVALVGVGLVRVARASPHDVSRVRVATFLAALVLAAGGFVVLVVDAKPVLCPDCEDPFLPHEPCDTTKLWNPKKLPKGQYPTLGGCI
jgi:hypothetical protein